MALIKLFQLLLMIFIKTLFVAVLSGLALNNFNGYLSEYYHYKANLIFFWISLIKHHSLHKLFSKIMNLMV